MTARINEPIRTAVFVSGNGTNLEAILQSTEDGILKGKIEVVAVLSDNKKAYALERAKKYGVQGFAVDRTEIRKENREKFYLEKIDEYKVSLNVLAGFMGLLSPCFIQELENRKIPCVNIHPTPTDQYRGAEGYKWVSEQQIGVNFSTMHMITGNAKEKFDEGPVVLYGLPYYSLYSADEINKLKKAGLEQEYRLITTVLNHIAEGAIQISGRDVGYSVGLDDFEDKLRNALQETDKELCIISFSEKNKLYWTIRFDHYEGDGRNYSGLQEVHNTAEIEDLLGFTLMRKEMIDAVHCAKNLDIKLVFNFLEIPLIPKYDLNSTLV